MLVYTTTIIVGWGAYTNIEEFSAMRASPDWNMHLIGQIQELYIIQPTPHIPPQPRPSLFIFNHIYVLRTSLELNLPPQVEAHVLMYQLVIKMYM